MATIDDTIEEVAQAVVAELGPYQSNEQEEREKDIALTAAALMSQRLNKSIDADVFFERSLEFQARAITMAENHTQVIIIAGYAAFFALWSAMAADIPRWAMLSSGSLMAVSLVVYMGWTIASLFLAKTTTEQTVKLYQDGPVDFWPRLQESELINLRRRNKFMKWWKPVVTVAGGAGLVASAVLSLSSGFTLASQAAATTEAIPAVDQPQVTPIDETECQSPDAPSPTPQQLHTPVALEKVEQ